jgi:hypothetical protein
LVEKKHPYLLQRLIKGYGILLLIIDRERESEREREFNIKAWLNMFLLLAMSLLSFV